VFSAITDLPFNPILCEEIGLYLVSSVCTLGRNILTLLDKIHEDTHTQHQQLNLDIQIGHLSSI